jgi:regulator of protease activity HflC (stomatin/prohibitin superfamily)
MNFKRIVIALLAATTLVACDKVPAGNVGVKVFLLGGDKGVDSEELGVGRYWIGWNEELYLFPTFMQNYVWTADSRVGSETDESISFQTADGNVANADIGISYSIDPTRVTDIFQKYRRGVDEITDTFLRNMVSDSLVKRSSDKNIEYVYGAGKASLIESVLKDVQDQVGPLGINVDKVYWLGEIRLDGTIKESINAKNAATQKAQQRLNEVQQSKAEADKKIEEARGEAESLLKIAEAQAKANKILAASLTQEFVQYQAITRWDGVLPTTMIPGQTTPFINVK